MPLPNLNGLCPQCGATISSRAKTCMNCGADLVAIAKAEEAQAKAIAREQRVEAAQRPTRIIVIIFTAIVIVLFVAIIVQSTRQSAIAALTPTVTRTPTRSIVLPTATPRATATPTGTPTPVPPLEYIVKNGDTPGRIALLYDLAGAGVDGLQRQSRRRCDRGGRNVEDSAAHTPAHRTATRRAWHADAAARQRSDLYRAAAAIHSAASPQKFDVPMSRIQERNNIQIHSSRCMSAIS